MKEEKPSEATLGCELYAPASVRAGEPVRVKLKLMNRGAGPVFVLGWRTPFEGMFGNDWDVTRGGVEIPYKGPMAKRGDPGADAYVTIAGNAAAEAEVELSLAYAMQEPGRYKVAFRGPLMDVATEKAEVPRPLDKHKAMALQCPAVEVEVTAP